MNPATIMLEKMWAALGAGKDAEAVLHLNAAAAVADTWPEKADTIRQLAREARAMYRVNKRLY